MTKPVVKPVSLDLMTKLLIQGHALLNQKLMTLAELLTNLIVLEGQISGTHIPILKDGKEVNLDFHIVSEEGVVKHIEMIEKQEENK